ncbi:hypothetical protein THIOM_003546 [Candidatus Thiomargarita nelsonii]|uniref:Uncharacterized protein n=1 Tax=Candidatus Thiomargarita nelsonii TaxID=1003181 RepID=A0A176RY65_9GAMM|nr:hypothetical protein THIOM_003546 [Candidatus Thiomargarita nelsonii]
MNGKFVHFISLIVFFETFLSTPIHLLCFHATNFFGSWSHCIEIECLASRIVFDHNNYKDYI